MTQDGGSAQSLMRAAARLEMAVDRLALAIGAARSAAAEAVAEDAMGAVPRAEVAALADRLDATIARLRGALAEEMRRAEDE
jgi:hypothetical protein